MTNKDIDTLLHVSLKPDYTPSDDLNQRLQERIHNGNDTAVLYHFHGSQRDKKRKARRPLFASNGLQQLPVC